MWWNKGLMSFLTISNLKADPADTEHVMTERKTILVPIDFSSNSIAALEYAAAFARDGNAELLIVHVRGPETNQLEGVGAVEALEALDDALHAVRPTDEGIPCSHRLIEGTPAQAIVETAAAEDVQMIVMGTHGRSGMARLVMGSVAEEVVRNAQCPVLTLRQSIEALTSSGT